MHVYKALTFLTPFTKLGKALPQPFDTIYHWSYIELVLRALGEDWWPERISLELDDQIGPFVVGAPGWGYLPKPINLAK